jgi:hypothetical protein
LPERSPSAATGKNTEEIMVALVGGNSFGLGLTSLATLGQRGVWGQAQQGRNGEAAYVNVVNGNAILQDRDEQLIGRGSAFASVRTYNSEGSYARR